MAPKRTETQLPNTPKTLLPLEKISIKLTEWIGTPYSLIAHTIFFIGKIGREHD